MTNEISIETVRLDSETRNHLLTLKRRTGIENWNVLARWALCVSLSDEAPLRRRQERGLGAVEMTWRTFAGESDDLYLALLVERCRADDIPLARDSLTEALRGHVGRGAARLVGNRRLKSITDLLTAALKSPRSESVQVTEIDTTTN
jgi:DNA sulfur modification protein DndE